MSVNMRRRNSDLHMSWSGRPFLIVLLVSFFVGVLAGGCTGFFLEPTSELREYLRYYCIMVGRGELQNSFLSVLWDCVRWPLLILLLGTTVLGFAGIPILFALRGFLLSFSASVFGLLLGPEGVAVAAVLFAVSALLILPTLFVLGCESLRSARLRFPGAASAAGKLYNIEIRLICCGVLLISVAVQWTVIPTILRVVCSHITF